MRVPLLLISMFCFSTMVLSQGPALDSLINASINQPDTVKIKTLKRISAKLNRVNPDSANHYVFQVLDLAKRIDDRLEVGKANLQIGINEKNAGNLNGADQYYNEALRIGRELLDTALMAKSLNGLGILYKKRGAFERSVNYYLSAANLYAESTAENAERRLAMVYNNLGNLVKNNGDFRASLMYHRKSLSIRIASDDKKEMARSYQNMANTFSQMESYDSSMIYFNKAEAIFKIPKMYDIMSLARLYNSKAELYSNLGQMNEAEKIARKSILLYDVLNNEDDMSNGYSVLAGILTKKNELTEAKRYALLAYDLNKNTGNNITLKEILYNLVDIYRATGEFEKGMSVQQELQAVNDSIFQNEKQRALFEAQAQFEVQFHQEQAELAKRTIDLEKTANAANEAKIKAELENNRIKSEKQTVWLFGIGIGGLLALVALVFSWRANIQRKRAHEQLEVQQEEILIKNKSLEKANSEITRQSAEISQKNKDITDSINYAKKIQTTALPDPNKLQTHFKDAFVLYNPKDIISGDFYWFTEVGDYVIVAVADCTGHGVPGALMSMTGLNLLNQIVMDKNISSPSEVLTLLDKGIYHALSVTVDSETKDGMDLALCAFNKKTKVVDFAGAARPLILVSGNDISTIKGNRESLGGHLTLNKNFTHDSIQLSEGDQLYMFSDGYADQFGGPQGKKFKNKFLREMIFQERLTSMAAQKEYFSDKFEDWKGDLEQVDDTCLIGFKV